MKAGDYVLNENMSLSKIVAILEKGPDASQRTVNITFLEGKNMRWIAKTIANNTNNTEDDVYNTLKNDSVQLINRIDTLCREYNGFSDNEKKWDYFYKKRESFNKKQIHNVTRSALFWFLMKAGYNGVYRVNSKGKFNVPCGKRDTIVYNKEKMEEISKKIQNVEF